MGGTSASVSHRTNVLRINALAVAEATPDRAPRMVGHGAKQNLVQLNVLQDRKSVTSITLKQMETGATIRNSASLQIKLAPVARMPSDVRARSYACQQF
jgi:hypothetical protein